MKAWPPRPSRCKITPRLRPTARLWSKSRRTRSRGWFNLGVALERAGRPEAAKAYSEALRLRPNDAALHLNLGVAYQESGDRGKAKASYERALELDPNSTTALWNLALVLEQDQNPQE